MRLGGRSWEIEEKRIDRLQRIRVTYDIISEDIKSIVSENIRVPGSQDPRCICPKCKGCGQKAPLFIGDHERIKFVSVNPGINTKLSKSRFRVVSYYLSQDYDSEYKGVLMEEQKWLFPDFFRFETICDKCDSEDSEFELETYRHVVYPDVTLLEFRYYGSKLRGEDPEWYETWNSIEDLCSCDPGLIRATLPQKVEIKMRRPALTGMDESEEEEEEIVFIVPIEVSDSQ